MSTASSSQQFSHFSYEFNSKFKFSEAMSPEVKEPHHRLFSSPIDIAEFEENNLKNESEESPELHFEFTNSFNRIMEKQNEEESERDELLDIMGNKICEFETKIEAEESEDSLSSINQDKENDKPNHYLKTPLKTPLKIYNSRENRSPLQDITPSMTHKKKKTTGVKSVSENYYLLTPRTLEKITISGSGLRRVERF